MTTEQQARDFIDIFEIDNFKTLGKKKSFEARKKCALICIEKVMSYLPKNRDITYFKETQKEIRRIKL